MTDEDTRHMACALTLARRGLGQVWPNPAVGCVIVSNGRVVGRGRTGFGGRPHAETAALDMAGSQARGATAYVTLEPCAHHGKTPPCADALIAAGVAKVVVAHEDPDDRVAGRGLERLRTAGVTVVTGVLEAEARRQQAGFLSRVVRGRPTVTLKLATSLDGRIATATGESRWITGTNARRAVHAMRLSHDAVMVGGGTARADDPTLTVRDIGSVRQPVRIVVSRHLRLPWPNRLAATAADGPVWLMHGDQEGDIGDAGQWIDAGVELCPVRVANGQIDVVDLLHLLGQRGLTRVFCEGGGAFAASLLTAGVVDELVAFTAGVALGAEGQPSLGALGVATLSEAPRLELVETRSLAPDVMTRWTVAG